MEVFSYYLYVPGGDRKAFPGRGFCEMYAWNLEWLLTDPRLTFRRVVVIIVPSGCTRSCSKLLADWRGMGFSCRLKNTTKTRHLVWMSLWKDWSSSMILRVNWSSRKSWEVPYFKGSCSYSCRIHTTFVIVTESFRSSGCRMLTSMSYVGLIEVLLGLIRATTDRNWSMHLPCLRGIIPWCFARYLSAYLSEMSHLSKEHPVAFKYISSGGLSVQLSNSNPFGRVPVDQTCEETVNKDTQTSGGTKGFSLKPNAVSKY